MRESYEEQDRQADLLRREIADERNLLSNGVPPVKVARKLYELAGDNKAGYDLEDILRRFRKPVSDPVWARLIDETVGLARGMDESRPDDERLQSALKVGIRLD